MSTQDKLAEAAGALLALADAIETKGSTNQRIGEIARTTARAVSAIRDELQVVALPKLTQVET